MSSLEKRTETIQFRCTSNEFAQWKALASAYQMPLSTLVRLRLNEAPMPKRPANPSSSVAVVLMLARIERQMMAIVDYIERGDVNAEASEMMAVLAELVVIERQLHTIMSCQSECVIGELSS